MNARFENKVALVTGGAGGIGAAIARRLAAEGASVAVGDVDREGGRALSSELGNRGVFISLDVSEEVSFASAIESIISEWGKLDVLVNNAGVVFPAQPVQRTSSDEFNLLVGVNLKGTYLGCRLAFPHLLETRGCVLNISSLVGMVGERSHAVYGATKGAINALTKCIAADWREHGIRVNSLCPSDVWTDALEAWLAGSGDEEAAEHYAKMRKQGFCAEPSEIGAIAAYLCSDESRFINGAVIPASFAAECGYEI